MCRCLAPIAAVDKRTVVALYYLHMMRWYGLSWVKVLVSAARQRIALATTKVLN